MYKIVDIKRDMFDVYDTTASRHKLCSASELVLALAKGVVIDGCKYGPKGLIMSYNGCEPFDVEVEVWKPVSIFNKRRKDGSYKYEVSNLGRVRITKYADSQSKVHKERLVAPNISKTGFYNIRLYDDSVFKSVGLSKLLAMEFVPGYEDGLVPCHLDGNRTNNSAYNLEWRPFSDTVVAGMANGKRSRKYAKPVRQYTLLGQFVAEYKTATEAARRYGGDAANISACCLGQKSIKSICGYIWRYKGNDELYGVDDPVAAGLIRAIRQYSKDGKFIAEFASPKDINQKLGIPRSTLSTYLACRRDKLCRDCFWRYSDNDEFASRPENIRARAEWRKSCNVEN